ncbi:odorant-binding protein 11 precursor [Acyrthosiphon pisum]|uniref:Odorant-binding protein 11 n=1 Tax=Acyrthosiphon pisum TaxID=7029 RepID=C5J8F1_ACYPI|nr:odorant-binding protein 11 precursor [Acyrthosiphon pisum]CAX63068.1 odorant-binding protein 11 [Acyrthosiphon pisum]|eukprot:NP_001155983.1 odorant-binding protein 11 precursor [Acyrthosiphon pisum]
MSSSTFYITLLFGIAMLISCGYGIFTTEQIDYYGKACNASEDDLIVLKSYKVPSTETGKCLMKCMITKLGLLNDDGSYNKTGMEAGLKKYWSEWATEKIETINEKCYEEGNTATLLYHVAIYFTCVSGDYSDVQLLIHCDGMFEQEVGSRQVNLKLLIMLKIGLSEPKR